MAKWALFLESLGIKKNLNIRKKLQIAFFLSAILPLAIGGIYSVFFSSRTLKNVFLSGMKREVEERGAELKKTMINAKGDLLFLSRLPTLKNYAHHLVPFGVSEPSEVREPVLEAFSNFATYRTGIHQIRFLDTKGRERLRVDSRGGKSSITPLSRLQDKRSRYYFREAMRLSQGEVYISPMDLNEEFGKIEDPPQPVLRLVTPFVNERGEKKGVVVLNLYAFDLLELVQKLETRPQVKTFFVNEDTTVVFRGDDGVPRLSSLYAKQNPMLVIPKENLFSGKSGIVEGNEHFLIHAPIFYQNQNGNTEFWVIALQYPKEIVFSPVKGFTVVLLLIGLVVALMALFLGGLAARQLSIPLLAIHREVEKVGRGNYDVHLKVETGDEIESLAHAFNAIASKIREGLERERGWNRQLQEEVNRAKAKLKESMQRIYRMEKMASLGELSAGIAHEVGNPLAAIKTVIQALDEDITPEKQRIYLGRILFEVDRLTQFLRVFHTFVTPGKEAFVQSDLGEIVENVVLLVGKEASKQKVRIRRELLTVPSVFGAPQQLQQILLNLLVNAFHALPEGGDIILRTKLSDTKPLTVSLSVSDNGIGIPEENLSRIFDPFFTTRHGGTGLGLAIVYKIAKEHGSEIRVKSEVGKGTTFEILFPLQGTTYA